jgi:anaerobic selenocysteine-containing dehydrogenase
LDCPDACSLSVTVENGRLTRVDGSPLNPLTQDFICGKVRRAPDHVHGTDRVLTPLLRSGKKGEGRFQPISWDDALIRTARALAETRARHGGAAILPFCYGGSNGMLTHDSVDARLFRRLGASKLLRTVCAAPSGAARRGLYGRMPGVALTDYEHARLIIVWGNNPHASGIHLLPILDRARANGARLVVCDPQATKLAKQADLHLPLRPGTDLPVALAIANWLFENNRADLAFLEKHTKNASELKNRAASWPIERAAHVAGISARDLERLARDYADTSPAVIRCGWGVERNRNGGSGIAAILALPAVAGKFGVRGGGYTMSQSDGFAVSAEACVNEPEPPTRAINMNQLGAALAAKTDPVHCLFVYNANPVATIPEQNLVRRGLERDDLFTIVFDAVMTDTTRYADVILPATTFLEHHELTKSYGQTVLLDSQPAMAPVGQARPNYEVFGELLSRLGLEKPGDAKTPDELRAQILKSMPDVARAIRDNGLSPAPHGTSPILFVDVFPGTPDKRIDLCPEALDREHPTRLYEYQENPNADRRYPLTLISPAMAQTTNSTFGQLIKKPASIFLSPEDARKRGITDGDRVRAFNHLGEVRVAAGVDPSLRNGVARLNKGLWLKHTENGQTATALCPATLSDLGGGACFNDAQIEIERA